MATVKTKGKHLYKEGVVWRLEWGCVGKPPLFPLPGGSGSGKPWPRQWGATESALPLPFCQQPEPPPPQGRTLLGRPQCLSGPQAEAAAVDCGESPGHREGPSCRLRVAPERLDPSVSPPRPLRGEKNGDPRSALLLKDDSFAEETFPERFGPPFIVVLI